MKPSWDDPTIREQVRRVQELQDNPAFHYAMREIERQHNDPTYQYLLKEMEQRRRDPSYQALLDSMENQRRHAYGWILHTLPDVAQMKELLSVAEFESAAQRL